jgi:ubiquinone biosynthesis protein UbiJ
MPATPAWLAALESLLNRGIAGSAQASELADHLNATTIQVDIHGVTSVQAGVLGGRLALLAAPPDTAAADATITGSAFALLQLARTGGKDGVSSATVKVRGDAEIANSYRRLFALARPDLEEEMSRLIGDFPARRLSQVAAKGLAWMRKARRTAGDNVAEYLQEESRDLVNRSELEEFLQDVDVLRDTADRVEARLARLERRLKGSL